MSASETLDLTRSLNRSLSTLLIWGALYGGLLLVLILLRPGSFPGDAALLIPALVGALVLTAGALVGGWFLWKRTGLESLKDFPSRKLGSKEREPGLTPRAQMLRKRMILTATAFEIPAFIGFALPLMGGRALLIPGMALIALSVATVYYLKKLMPARVREVLG